MSLRFDAFSPKTHLDEQRALFLSCFPETVGTSVSEKRHYDWKFHSAAPRTAREYAAWEDHQLVGYYAALSYPYLIDAERRTAAMVCDVMTAPAMRGRGVFAKLGSYSLAELTKERFDFAIGYPIRPEVIPGHLKVGWSIAFDLPMYVQFLRFDELLKERRLGWAAPFANAVASLYRKARRTRPAATYRASVVNLAALLASGRYDDFRAAWSASSRCRLDKTPSFLRWRLGAPQTSYKVVCVDAANELAAMAITRLVVLKGIPTLAVLDLMVKPGHEAAQGTLHAALTSLGQEENAAIVAMVLTRSWAKTYRLAAHAFLRSPFVFKVILRALGSPLPSDLLDERAWHLTWLDSDDL